MSKFHMQWLLRLGCLVLAAIIILCALITPEASAKSVEEYYENAVLYWTNVERSRNGLPALKTNDTLRTVADTRAAECVSAFGHTRPDGRSWTTAITSAGISYNSAGENLSAGKATPCEVVSSWMNSSGHRANILAAKFGCLAVGYEYAPASKYTHYWAQEFVDGKGLPCSEGFYVAPTGIAADKSALTLSVGGTEKLAGLPSPVYATEIISCTSSDSSVVKVESVQVNVFTLRGVSDGRAELKLRCGNYSVTVSVKVGSGIGSSAPEQSSGLPFVDVSRSAGYYDAVVWAYENGVTDGTDGLHYSPNASCTRAQAVTFLWRAAGCPSSGAAGCPFTDVKRDVYYYDAVVWAYRQGITEGVDASHFGPELTVTREQFVTMLWKLSDSPRLIGVNPFADVSGGSYYKDAVLWAYRTGVTAGVSAGRLGVGEPCLRYQVASMLYRCMN